MRSEHSKAQTKPWYGGWWQMVKAGLVLAAMVGGYTALSRRKEHGDIETATLPEFSDSPYFAEKTDIPLAHEAAQRQLFSSSASTLPVSAQYPAIFELGNLSGFSGFKLDGEPETIHSDSGFSVSTAGDVNGDGYTDIIIGDYGHNNTVGCSYVVFGGSNIDSQDLLPLANLNGTNGFKLDGEATHDYSGLSVNTAGDINGDGYADIIIGAYGYNNSVGVGRSYVIFGGRNVGSQGLLPLASLNGTNGFKLDGEPRSASGYSVSTAGDMNGDGYADIIIGAYGYNNDVGRSYVIFGGSKVGSQGLLPLASLNGPNGFKLDGEASGLSGSSVSTAGDMNGDGYTDVIIGAKGYNGNVGRSYVIFGGSKVGSQGLLPLASLNGTNGFKLDGEASSGLSGSSVSTAGDINGDGYTDVIIGANGYNNNVGRSYVIFGGSKVGSQGLLPLASLNGINGFKLDDEAINDVSGHSVSTTGDINGDGYADIIIGVNGHNKGVGRSYVVFGGRNVGNQGLLPLASLNGSNGFKLDGEASSQSGSSVSTAGDINGDSYADILIGAPGYDIAGRSYAILGSSPDFALVNNQLTIHQTQTVLLTANDLNTTNHPYSASGLWFTVSACQHGYFSTIDVPTQPIARFNQSQIWGKKIQFVQDGSALRRATTSVWIVMSV